MERSKQEQSAIARSGMLMPQESMLEVKKSKHNLYIGIPRETSYEENRIALVPESVALLVNNGHEVVIETEAGKAANFTDNDYSEAGARIAYSPEEVFKANTILKVAPPSEKETEMMHQKQTLISILQISTQKKGYVKLLGSKKVTAIAFDYIKDKTGIFPLVQAMSEIVGSASILIAAEYLSNANNGKGELLAGITGVPPTEVLIIGAGTVGEFAARAALGLGAMIKVFDNSTYKLRRLQNNLGQRVYTSTIIPKVLTKAMKSADVVIGAMVAKGGRSPVVVTEEMVSDMKFGSVVIDVSIDQGGCIETSEVRNHSNPTFRKYGVIHYCVPNIASRVSRTASYAFSNILTPMLLNMGEGGGVEEMLWKNESIRNGVYLYKGTVTNKIVSDHAALPYKDLNLLFAARI